MATKYKWTFDAIAEMTSYQMAVAVGGVIEGDKTTTTFFDDYDAALEAIANARNPI